MHTYIYIYIYIYICEYIYIHTYSAWRCMCTNYIAALLQLCCSSVAALLQRCMCTNYIALSTLMPQLLDKMRGLLQLCCSSVAALLQLCCSTNYTNAAAPRQDARLGAQSGGEETTVIEQILSSVRYQVSRRA
jgi:hypothetical protein